MDTMDMEDTEAIMATPDPMGLMAMDTTMARGPQMLSLLLRPMPLLGPMLIRRMDTTVTMERGLLRLCLLLRPRLPPRLRLIPGMDTMDMDTGLMATDTMDTGLMVMDTGERSKKPEYCQLI